MDEQAFLDAIIASPGDDLPRLVFADWLEECGRSDLGAATAEFIRLTCGRSRKDGKPYQMLPTGAGAWLKGNWRRLVPTLTVCWDEVDEEDQMERWINQTVLRAGIPVPLTNSAGYLTIFRPVVWLYFDRGFVTLARWSAPRLGPLKIAKAIAQDQPLAEQIGPGALTPQPPPS